MTKFDFACHRCGHCCSVATGYVWLTEEEIPRLAAAMQMSTEAFALQYVRRIGERLSLTEKAGRCALLAPPNHCTVYSARPKHCKDFPYWPDILAGGEALRRAREYCPGIQIYPTKEMMQETFAVLAAYYQRLAAELSHLGPVCIQRGICCEFEKADHVLFASLLEVDYAAVYGEELPEAEQANRCRYHINRLCHNRAGRPLGCRTYFCDPTFAPHMQPLYEKYQREIREICKRLNYPWGYGNFLEHLKARSAKVRKIWLNL